jgi:hypothetical protein
VQLLISHPESVLSLFKIAPMVDSVARADAARLLADQADGAAQLESGHYFKEGEGVEVDMEEAAQDLKPSADHGNSSGQIHYGRCLELGNGVPLGLSDRHGDICRRATNKIDVNRKNFLPRFWRKEEQVNVRHCKVSKIQSVPNSRNFRALDTKDRIRV